ncbi:MAG: dephospho-CoA kinase, partial [Verrucomicrobia bacterium]|nr:dephospho-CoA kinase [Verrucomicrobiota bacterium]
DKIACVVCSPELQRERLRAREWSDDQISNRISAQMAVGEKIKRADHVIWTDGTIEAHAAQWDDLVSSWDVVD